MSVKTLCLVDISSTTQAFNDLKSQRQRLSSLLQSSFCPSTRDTNVTFISDCRHSVWSPFCDRSTGFGPPLHRPLDSANLRRVTRKHGPRTLFQRQTLPPRLTSHDYSLLLCYNEVYFNQSSLFSGN